MLAEKKILLPIIDGYYSDFSNNEILKEYAETFVPEGSRLIYMYIKNSDIDLLKKGKEPEFDPYIMIQCKKSHEDIPISEKTFQGICAEYEKMSVSEVLKSDKIEKEMSKMSSNFQDKYNTDYQASVKESKDLGIFKKSKNQISSLHFNYFRTMHNGEKYDHSQICSVNFVRASDRLIFFYIYKLYNNIDDINFVKSTSKQLANQIITSNPSFLTGNSNN